jgi:hypothetical protein
MSTFRFFVNETNLFFAFDHEKTNDSSFFTFTKLKYWRLLFDFSFVHRAAWINATFRFEIESKPKVMISSCFDIESERNFELKIEKL